MRKDELALDDVPEARDLEHVRVVYQLAMLRESSTGSEHVADVLWEKLACGELSRDERTQVADHVTRCRTCQQIYRTTVQLRDGARAFDPDAPSASPDAPVVRGRQWWPYAVAAAAVIVAAVLVRPLMRSSQSQPGATRTLTPAPTVILVAPLGTVTSVPAVFRWEPVAGSQAYRVRVFSDQGVPLWTSADIVDTSVARPDPVSLSPGRYFWRVTALADGEVLAESPLSPFVISP